MSRRVAILAAWLMSLAAVGAALASGAAEPASAKPQARPNIIVVITDDMPLSYMNASTLPNTIELLGNQGTTFTDSVVTTPLCCPSRAAYLTGQYGHNNGVLSNRPGYGDLVGKTNTLPVWLRNSGYTTIHLGRYFNGYKEVGGTKVAPGWDRWFTALEPRNYYDYDLEVNDRTVHYGKAPKDYLTSVINGIAVREIRKQAKRKRPFYMQVDQLAPHDEWRNSGGPCGASAIPGPGDLEQFANEPLPEGPSFNEQDMSDKPPYMAVRPVLNEVSIADITREYRCRLASMLAVDRGVERIVSTLAAKGELDNTLVVFTSDNGFYNGEHRVPFEKYLPYEEGIHMPLLARFPASVGAVSQVDPTVSQIDLTATILELAGAPPCMNKNVCRTLDGRSFLPLARGETPDWVDDRGILIELDRRFGEGLKELPCFYDGIRTATDVYIEYLSVPDPIDGLCRESFQAELYDLAADPFQLENLYPTKPGTAERERQAQLKARLDVLRDCAGIEGRDPVPASGHYCE
jgi:arylsulfatase A-like enzyme